MTKVLPKRKMYRYCLADIAKGLFTGMISNYLLYFFQPTTKSGLPSLIPDNKLLGFITIMALVTAIGKVVDAITDPLVASWSDKCTHKAGRRMPFLRYSALPYALSVLLIFYAPFGEGSIGNAIWVGVFIIVYYTSYTLFFIPRNALIPEIIPDTKVRVGYYGISTAFFMGSSSFMYAATLFVDLLKKAGLTPLWAWRSVFTFFAAIGIVCLLLSATAFNEKDYVEENTKPKESIFKSFALVFKNKEFVVFTAGDLFSGVSMAFFQTAMLYYITMLLGVPESQSFLVMLTAIAVALCLFPLIIKISRKFNKKTPLVLASIVFTIVFGIIYFGDKLAALAPGNELYVGLAVGVIVAFPFAAINILPQSIISDIIQRDSIENGVNREGIFSAVKTFIEKVASAVAMMGVSSILAIGAASGESVSLLGVKLTGVFAGVFSLLSLVFFMFYNDKKVVASIEKGRK
ncbi:MAG: MFS transporter [Clostridia bacterium]|nr:MFS transporter [Clostridia bacterium]MBQ1996330.1 MFS transporter [Clostridia bacterium]MBQ5905382.1 MFS transporter [Clostridia bacterium]